MADAAAARDEGLGAVEALVEATLAVVEWDAELRIARWSGQAPAVFGWSAEEALGRRTDALGLLEPGVAAALSDRVHGLAPQEPPLVTRQAVRTRTGGRRSCEWHSSPVRGEDGRTRAVLSLIVELAESDVVETTLRRADRRRDEFLATLAHELRNPLAPMRNALEIMRLAGRDSGAAERARELIERQLAQMVRLIDDLLDVSRISLGRLELRRSRVELGSVVAGAVEASRPAIEASGHQLSISLPRDPVFLDGDPARLAQALSGLLGNASRYMEAGGRIRLSAESLDGEVVVRVRDEGVGIAAEMLPHVFSMFTEGSHFGQRSDNGLGIGLMLVRQLLELHGGRISAQSEGPGRGSEFVITLPTVPAPVDAGAGPPPRRPARSSPRRILVVDDNCDAATSLATMLRMMGHETHTAYDGASALAEAARNQPDVVLLDIGMPGMSGYEVASRIRASSWGQHVSLIALTGWGQEEDVRRSQEAGFDRHLVKPVHPEMLAGVLAVLDRA